MIAKLIDKIRARLSEEIGMSLGERIRPIL
jgi:hypothetical protein